MAAKTRPPAVGNQPAAGDQPAAGPSATPGPRPTPAPRPTPGAKPTNLFLKRLTLGVLDALAINAVVVAALYIRLDGGDIGPALTAYWHVALFYTVGTLVIFYVSGLYHAVWRYAGAHDAVALLFGTMGSAIIFGFVTVWPYRLAGFPRSVVAISWTLNVLAVAAVRSAGHLLRTTIRLNDIVPETGESRAVLVGAGPFLGQLTQSLIARAELRIRPVVIVDVEGKSCGSRIQGIPVGGGLDDLETLALRHRASMIIVAPSPWLPDRAGLVARTAAVAARHSLVFRVVPTLSESLGNEAGAEAGTEVGAEAGPEGGIAAPAATDVRRRATAPRLDPRPADPTDLLNRRPAEIDAEAARAYLKGARVMVTGASGSIGSEICRQVAAFQPELLILLANEENGLYELELELRRGLPGQPMTVVVADVRDRAKLAHVFQDTRPTVVFHAAAHKHVPLMELAPDEAVKTNILGTKNVAELAVACRVDRLVFISTDKAVNPTSVMGASKRVAEHVIRSLKGNPGGTRLCAVRFGNVLGSKGSVVPIFEDQMAHGRPITITHPEMTRFFMTIPEAARLVIQAGAMTRGGELFALDMGEPVKIIDLARNLARLKGLDPDRDLRFEYIGVRPGEKLYEEVLTRNEVQTATKHSRVFIAKPDPVDRARLGRDLRELERLAAAIEPGLIVAKLREMVPGYRPAAIHTVPPVRTEVRPEAAVAGLSSRRRLRVVRDTVDAGSGPD